MCLLIASRPALAAISGYASADEFGPSRAASAAPTAAATAPYDPRKSLVFDSLSHLYDVSFSCFGLVALFCCLIANCFNFVH